jgi:hypothetical protein
MFTRVFISYFLQRCHDSFSSEPDIYHNRSRRTFVNIQPSTSKVSKSIISLIQHYKWSIISVLFTVLSVSLDCPLLNAPSVFSQIYCPHTLDIFESASTPFYEILFLRRLQVMQLFDSVLQINMFFWFFLFVFFLISDHDL